MSSTGMLAEPSPAEPAPPQDSIGGTHTPRPPPSNIRGSKTSELKKVHNAFAHQARYLTEQREPELWQHLQDLTDKHAKGHRCIAEFKRLIAECKKGDFDTPALRAVKKRIKIKEWGKQTELATWKQVLDRLGENVAYAALRQGTLPYVPHSLLLPGHGVKWPDSHEFVLEKYWHENWREEVVWQTDDEDPTAVQVAVDDWLSKIDPPKVPVTY